MTEKIVIIRKEGRKPKCYSNVNMADVLYNIKFITDNPQSRIRVMKRTKAKRALNSFGSRLGYIFKAIRTAFSKEFIREDVPRHQGVA